MVIPRLTSLLMMIRFKLQNFFHMYFVFILFLIKRKKHKDGNKRKKLFKKIFRKYDLSINLTASDRSVLYALLASKYAIGCVEDNKRLAWWKNLLLKRSYNWDSKKHILLNNLEPLNCLKIKCIHKTISPGLLGTIDAFSD